MAESLSIDISLGILPSAPGSLPLMSSPERFWFFSLSKYTPFGYAITNRYTDESTYYQASPRTTLGGFKLIFLGQLSNTGLNPIPSPRWR